MPTAKEGRSRRRLVAAPDKFRGTAGAADVAAAMAQAAVSLGWAGDELPVADGGEGTLEVLGGPAVGGKARYAAVRGPLGEPVQAEWRWRDDGTGVVEMARASGISLVGGPEGNDPLRASTHGTGELIAAAIDSGAVRVIVGLGGSASTDGGLGALTALNPRRRVGPGVELTVGCDVDTLFLDAAEAFGPQKGATPAQVSLLRRRLERLADVYIRDFGVDITGIPGSGAAGGLAGGLAAAGAELVGGFDLVADELGLAERIQGADLVVTGEGCLDGESFHGKAVGGVVELARSAGVPVLIVAGEVATAELPRLPTGVMVESLVDHFGPDRATTDTLACIREVVANLLARP